MLELFLTTILPIYLIAINIVALTAMYIDKQRSIKGEWRIPEKRLFLYALIGGGIGATAGMNLFRHKTKHWYFRFGFPFIALLQIILYAYLYLKFVNPM